MTQAVVHVSIVVRGYDEAIAFYCEKLGFDLIEDTYQAAQDKRWVVVAPKGWKENGTGTALVLGRATNPQQEAAIGNQSGGRVFLFLRTDNFDRDRSKLLAAGVEFVREPAQHDYGKVAVFSDCCGNLWDLVQFAPGHPLA